MLLSAVSVLVVAQSSSEIPEGLMNDPVCAALQDVVLRSFINGSLKDVVTLVFVPLAVMHVL